MNTLTLHGSQELNSISGVSISSLSVTLEGEEVRINIIITYPSYLDDDQIFCKTLRFLGCNCFTIEEFLPHERGSDYTVLCLEAKLKGDKVEGIVEYDLNDGERIEHDMDFIKVYRRDGSAAIDHKLHG